LDNKTVKGNILTIRIQLLISILYELSKRLFLYISLVDYKSLPEGRTDDTHLSIWYI